MAYLYKHIRKDTNEVFYVGIGSDVDYSRAHTRHKRSSFWKKIINKTDYEIIIYEDNKTWDEVIELEKYWISFYGRRDLNGGSLVNLTNGGEGCYGRILSEDTKKKIGEKSKLKIYSKEYREKLSESFKGEKNHRFGKKLSDETKQKISKSQLGESHHWYGTKRPHDVKEKIGSSQPNRIEVCKYDMEFNLITCYCSIGVASKENNISLGNLVTYLKKSLITKQNKLRHLSGFIWKYKF
jgi:hypothetical protein